MSVPVATVPLAIIAPTDRVTVVPVTDAPIVRATDGAMAVPIVRIIIEG